MDVDPPEALQQQQQPYAIVRIKRKRNEEPLDALVVDAAPSKKRSRGGLNVFKYAGTVEEAAWNDEQQKRALQKRLAGLARDSSQRKREDMSALVAASQGVPPQAPAQGVDTYPAKAHSAPPLSPKRTKYQAPSRTYTIVQQEEEDPYARRRHATAPPKVWSSKDYEAMKRAAQFKMYEAVPSVAGAKPGAAPTETDAEIEKFLPLLKDYLNVSELPPPPVKGGKDDEDMEQDYVYDVFYHRPTTFQELYQPGSNSNIATLTNVPNELLLDPDIDSDDEYDDEDDEDSNAEDWYANDYPDEEESDRDAEEDLSGDEFHEASDAEPMYERGVGAYRDVMSDDF
ncbi:hypothetical protein C8Q74DRAFT_1275190 [Fomes fomentarius]|nr:hypothetical protein C8Q74DRAFT_1275190 [Fomes fomentarius]